MTTPAAFRTDVSLAPLTTFGVGGSARIFAAPDSVESTVAAYAYAQEQHLPIFILGGGSNILVADEGFDGAVIAPKMSDIQYEQRDEQMLVTVGSGVLWDDFVADTVRRGLIGLECLSGIPGTVGGAVVANLGAYGAQCSDVLVSTDVLVLEDGARTVRTFSNAECLFSYHESIFNRMAGSPIVLRATFSLATAGNSRLSYRDNRFDLEKLAQQLAHEPTPAEVREAILHMRREKGMVAGMYKSAGSFFHMPFVSAEKYADILALVRSVDAEKEEQLRPWAWEQPDGSYKIAGGFLLEYTEFTKGYVRDGAGISPRHTLSIINVDGACARTIAELACDMARAVEHLFGVSLEREVEYVGNFL